MNQSLSRTLRYLLLPEFLPRVRDLLRDGFGFVAYAMACVFQTAGLLPRSHAYANPVNIGRFGIRHVLAQAAMNLKFNRKHADQLVLYVLILVGCVILVAQFGLMGFALFAQTAHATTPLPTTFSGFFETPDPTNDIASVVLDRIFGIPDLFGSCVSQQIACFDLPGNPNRDFLMADGAFPQPYHLALQDMLGFYSYGLLFVATVILVYYIITILAEMSETGTAFGRRFNRAWAPIRMIVAFGLLIPMSYNLNAAQYITLYTAKWGSGLATNSWNFFITRMALTDERTLTGDRAAMVSRPQYPAPSEILQFMSTAWTCKVAYRKMYDIEIDAYFLRSSGTQADDSVTIASQMGQPAPYYDLQRWFQLGDVEIVFGEKSQTKYAKEKGFVHPTCGSVSLSSLRVLEPENPPFQDGADMVPYNYLSELIWMPWGGGQVASSGLTFGDLADIITNRTLPLFKDMSEPMPGEEEKSAIVEWYNETVQDIVDDGYAAMRDDTDWAFEAMEYGWGGAAIWYNKIAQVNGEFFDAVANLPTVTSYPVIMENIREERSKNNTFISAGNAFDPHLGNGMDLSEGMNERDKAILMSLNKTYDLWGDFYEDTKPPNTGNVIVDAINVLFKKSGLWTLRDNENIHPLASFSAMGRALLMHSVLAFGGGAVTGVGGAVGILGSSDLTKAIASNMTSFLISVGYIGMAMGFMLYYVVPLMPFIYFFFAIVGWAKTIFEAMVGVPLWALAHLRYDGDGFPTRQSLYGYYLLLDIFIRPVLVVFALIGSVIIFYALARTLNNIFDTVTSNLTGFDSEAASAGGGPAADQPGSLAFLRGPIDQFFFTIIYTVTVYMMGMSCFKMIDLFPNGILRWMGSSARGLSASNPENAGEEMAGKIKGGTYQFSDDIGGLSNQVLSNVRGAEFTAPSTRLD